MRICRVLSTFLACLLLSYGIAAADQQWEEAFFKANQAYKEGHFQQAIDGYSQLVGAGFETGHLFYNLGDAYFRLNQLGQAILNYERANILIPRDPDLKFNLGHARDQTKDAISEPDGFISMVFFWLDSLNLDEFFWGFSVINVLFWGILLIRLFRSHEWSYYLVIITLAFWIIFGASFGLKWYQTTNDDRAVILKNEVNVLAGPDIRDTVLFRLHAGTVVRFERSEDGWSLIRLPDKKRGWVNADAIDSIILDDHFKPA